MGTVQGTYPFGQRLRILVQTDRAPKRIFVLGVYASAVHARWIGPEGNVLVRALAVASEPVIFWNGIGADDIVASVAIPAGAGRLISAEAALNGPSGRSLENDYLGPLRISRPAAWLCDLVPYSCLNPGQTVAIQREYEPRRIEFGLPEMNLPKVPRIFADDERRGQILREIDEANPDVLVLLGDQPIKAFLAAFDSRWSKLSDFGVLADDYGRLHEVTLGSRRLHVLPLAHPRQASGLGFHSGSWRRLHAEWKRDRAPGLLT